MKNLTQTTLSVLTVVAAATVVGFRVRKDGGGPAQGAAGGHNHAAMVAGGDTKPVRLDDEQARRIGVTFAHAEVDRLEFVVRSAGTIGYDETGLVTVSPKVDGWIEHLFVDFTGAPVTEGQPLLDVYSPGLVSAQEELVLAARLAREAPGGRAADNARGLLESARRRLSYWDIPGDEIRRIETSGEVRKTLTLRAPSSGVVVVKNVVEGDRIMPGMAMFQVASLAKVWIEADIYEKDLELVHAGQEATVRVEALPGRSFQARITYVYPTVSMASRTGRVRLELPNPDLDFKPGMYADIRFSIPAASASVVVPRSAVLATGERALVFVEGPDGALVPREITVGRTAGQRIEVLAGLDSGERVVTSAAFLIDAESNLGSLTSGVADPNAPGEPSADMEGMDMPGMDLGGTNQAADTSRAGPDSRRQGH